MLAGNWQECWLATEKECWLATDRNVGWQLVVCHMFTYIVNIAGQKIVKALK
jgi:hypothetical protein